MKWLDKLIENIEDAKHEAEIAELSAHCDLVDALHNGADEMGDGSELLSDCIDRADIAGYDARALDAVASALKWVAGRK